MPEKMADRVTQLQDAINQVRDGSRGEESSHQFALTMILLH